MTEVPDEDQTRRDEHGEPERDGHQSAGDSLAGEFAREMEPDPEEPGSANTAREAGPRN